MSSSSTKGSSHCSTLGLRKPKPGCGKVKCISAHYRCEKGEYGGLRKKPYFRLKDGKGYYDGVKPRKKKAKKKKKKKKVIDMSESKTSEPSTKRSKRSSTSTTRRLRVRTPSSKRKRRVITPGQALEFTSNELAEIEALRDVMTLGDMPFDDQDFWPSTPLFNTAEGLVANV